MSWQITDLLAPVSKLAPPSALDWGMLAQATTDAPPPMNPIWDLLVPMALVMGVFLFMSWRGQAAERKKFQQMLDGLTRNDRVQTIGGVIGTIVDVRDDEIVLRVDESNNVKMHFVRSAIKHKLGDDTK